ncbi:hypothetical protein B0F90DRAFT_1622629 [Multifurca ochricompacta]|uniref:Uncharacterized protein n=1 Tax=Multifurca ochricompacta TaxID=376703 RepID=A0AAD4MBA0_9AGAM|nr:hypothetical protein B0F90DRAFT_1622629 [Multifurca ochricompacta]
MCYIYGSVQVTTSVCPMCKVFKPSSARCPHKHDVCKNSALHPRHDVVHMRNAEVQTFNGCGYCKWARTNPPPKQAGLANPGWPGCCRKPESGESRLIPPADWPAVSTVHHIPVPPEIKALLESINVVASKSSPSFGNSALLAKTTSSSISPPSLDRRSSSSAVPSRAASTARTQPLAIPTKSRSTGSPKEPVTSLASGSIRTSLRDSPPTSNLTLVDFGPTHHRKTSVDYAEKRGDSPNTPSPIRRSIELERVESSRGVPRRSSVSKATSASLKSAVDTPPVLRRRASITESSSHASLPLSSISRALERRETISAGRPNIKKSSLDIDFSALSLSGGGSSKSPNSAYSDSSDSSSQSGSSDGTITSDGAFTDYLSDESDAELQKQAEAKAALLAQTHAEEREFRAARQQLASVDLRPPKSWGAGNGSGQMAHRPQGADTVYSVLSTSSYTTHARGQVDAIGVGRAR